MRAGITAAVVIWAAVPGALGAEAGTPARTVHVDASAAPGGDGSVGHPFRALAEALGPGPLRIALADGVYAGGLLLDGVELVGGTAVVLSAVAPATVLRTRGAVRLQNLQLQGGAVGLEVQAGRAELEGVRFSGQRTTALAVAEGAELAMSGSSFQASVSGVRGLRLAQGSRTTVRDTAFAGPFQRAVDATRPALLRLEGVRTRDAVTAVQLDGGEAWLGAVEAAGGRGPAFYVAHGTLHLQGVTVTGHEYALLTGEDAVIEGEDFRSQGAIRAGMAMVRTRASLSRVRIEGAGDHGALSLVSSDVQLTDLVVSGGLSGGLSMREGQLRLNRGRFTALLSADATAGDALQIRGGQATLTALEIQGCSGIGVLAAEGARVELKGGTVRGAGVAGLAAETGGQLLATEVTIRDTRGPAVLVLDGARARLVRIQASANRDGAVWAECSHGAAVEVVGWSGEPRLAPSACIQLGAR